MKTKFNFLLGLIVLILTVTSTQAAIKIVNVDNASKFSVNKLFPKRDYHYFKVAYSATQESPGVYRLKVYLLDWNATTDIYTPYPAPANLLVTMTAGPFSGTSFYIYSGESVHDYGTFTLPSQPTGDAPATMNPQPLNGTTVIPELYELNHLLTT